MQNILSCQEHLLLLPASHTNNRLAYRFSVGKQRAQLANNHQIRRRASDLQVAGGSPTIPSPSALTVPVPPRFALTQMLIMRPLAIRDSEGVGVRGLQNGRNRCVRANFAAYASRSSAAAASAPFEFAPYELSSCSMTLCAIGTIIAVVAVFEMNMLQKNGAFSFGNFSARAYLRSAVDAIKPSIIYFGREPTSRRTLSAKRSCKLKTVFSSAMAPIEMTGVPTFVKCYNLLINFCLLTRTLLSAHSSKSTNLHFSTAAATMRPPTKSQIVSPEKAFA